MELHWKGNQRERVVSEGSDRLRVGSGRMVKASEGSGDARSRENYWV